MNRLQKKCIVASATFHLALLAVLLLGPAFSNRKDDAAAEPILTFIPDTLVDSEFSNLGPGPEQGGPPAPANPPPQTVVPTPEPAPTTPPPSTPTPQPPTPKETTPPPPPQPQPQPQTQPPPPTPKESPRERSVEPTPPPPKTTPPQAKAEPKPKETKPPTKKPEIKVDLTLKKLYPADAEAKRIAAETKARADAERRAKRAAEQYQNQVRGSLDLIAKQSSTRTEVLNSIAVGPAAGGGGSAGEVYASYKSVVFSVYVRAWIPPEEIEDEAAAVEAQVTIARDGTVLRDQTRILKRSGIPALDKSVQAALDRVRSIAPFPASSTDSQRTFIIGFNLKAKRSLG